MRAAVTDGNSRAALAVIRSLGKVGYWIAAGAETKRSLAGASRYAADTFCYPSPLADVEEAMEVLAREVKRRSIDWLIPVTDITLIPVLQYRERYFKEVRIPYPSLQTVMQASDKFFLFQLAQECGIPIPRTIFVNQPFCPHTMCSQIPRFPVVVKPARSVFPEHHCLTRAGVSYVDNKERLLRLLEEKDYLRRHPFLLQERIIGQGIGYFVLLDKGKPLAEFSHRRIREKPPCGGVSVFSESIPVRPDIREYSLKLLNRLGWSGIAMVEFKLDKKTDTPMLMEINGRFWGSLQLAIDAGVDFPYLLVSAPANGSLHEAPQYRPYLRWRWLLGDLDNLLLRLFKPQEVLSLTPDYPSRMRSLVQFLSAFLQREISYDVLCRNDIRPFLHEVIAYVRQLAR